MTEEFGADNVAGDFADAIDTEVVQRIGWSPLGAYDWGGDEDEIAWPFVVVRDDREFEVDIDVRVTELTPEVKQLRKEEEDRVLELLKKFDQQKREMDA